MSIAQHFYTTVPESGMITLPPEFRGTEVMIRETAPKKPIPVNRDEFRRKKTLDEIVAEQGGPRICTNPERLFEGFPKLWDTEEELAEFLERRKY